MKTVYTERDIDDLHNRGVTSIQVGEAVLLTDLARERCAKYDIRLVRGEAAGAPSPPSDEALVERIKSAVIARLGDQVDATLLDGVVRRVLANLKR